MKIPMFLFQRETRAPMLALTFASAVCVALVAARIVWTHNVRYSFLVWNLFLAWLPLAFALLFHHDYQRGAGKGWRLAVLGAAWLLFFPNAAYIFTDLIHLTGRFYRHFWVDMVLILICALTGLVLGFVSLYLTHSVVERKLGRVASWLFVAMAAGLGGFGIYVGRFLHFNSWDVLAKPVALYQGIGAWATEPTANPTTLAFPVLFATFLFIAYVMLFALTHMQPALAASPPPGRPEIKPQGLGRER